MTGGDVDEDGLAIDKSVEVLHSDGTPWCSLPDLPVARSHHSQTGLLTCGGVSYKPGPSSCTKFSGGKWKLSHKFKEERYMHSSWASPRGTVLMGGTATWKTAELLDDTTRVSVMHFPLKYDTE